MRALVLLLLLVGEAGAVMPFSWSITDGQPGSPTGTTITVPEGMIWHVEQVTGFHDLLSREMPVGMVTPSANLNPVLYLSPSSTMLGGSNTSPYFFADYSRQVTVRLTGDLTMRNVNGTFPRRLLLSGYLTPSLSGDYNGDGLVDAADYTVLRDNAAKWEPSDMFSWQDNYGAVSAAAGTTIPEPYSAILAACSIVLTLKQRRTRGN